MPPPEPSSQTRTTVPREAGALDSLDQGRFSAGDVVGGRFRVVALLGRGGMGEVYRAEDLKLRLAVALKFLPLRVQSDPARLARFHREVRLAREVSHPNVCRVHDIGEADGVQFLSMEYVDGEDLASLLRRIGRLPRDKALDVSRQICAGLAAAHDRGVIHRDLKPANVMIDGRGRVRITDFGLATGAGEAAGEIAGTPGYMAPEQAAGQPASVRTDVYALGLVLYEVMTGQAAFGGGSTAEVLRRQRDSAPRLPSALVPEIGPTVERAILRCLEKDPARRPPSALSVSAALLGGDPLAALVAAGETPPPEMVADAGGSGALRPAAAWALLGAIAVCLPLGLWVGGQETLAGPIALDKPPEVLADRARAILERLGRRPAGGHEAFGFGYERGALVAHEWDRAVRFWYRASPVPLQPRNPFGTVSPDDPAPTRAGMATVWLDARGRLLELLVVPAGRSAVRARPVDWSAIFAEAGMDFARYAPAEPTRAPPVGTDTVLAWVGPDPRAPARDARVEGASWRGGAAFFAVAGEAEPAFVITPGPAPGAGAGSFSLARAAWGLLSLAIVLTAVVFTRRNLSRGRGDREGAFRLAAVAFGVSLLSWWLEMWPVLSLDGVWRFVVHGTEVALWNAAFVWLFYLAVEPFVRRRWPESLISWSRLLAGRFRDPRVGRDLLVGLAALWGLVLGVGALYLAPQAWGETIARAGPDLSVAGGVRPALVWFVDGVDRAMWFCMFVLVLLLLLRSVLRRAGAAIVGLGLVFAAITPAVIPGAHWTLAVANVALPLATLALVARVGLVAAAVIGFCMDPFFPLTPHLGAWYGLPTAMLVGLTAVGAVYGFVVALGGRSPFGEGTAGD